MHDAKGGITTGRQRRLAFFEEMAKQHLALTFNDVRLVPGFSEVLPTDIDIQTRCSRTIPLKIPVVSAAMDTVTGPEMAIRLAELGGLGVIHRNFPAQRQAQAVKRVKQFVNGIIQKPIKIRPSDQLRQILDIRAREKYQFHTFPVVDNDGRLVGLMEKINFDLYRHEPDTTVEDAMTRHIVTSKADTTREQALEIMRQHTINVLPLVDDNQRLIGMYSLADILRVMAGTALPHNVDDEGRLRVGAAIGTETEDFNRAKLLIRKGVDVLFIDTAHGHTSRAADIIRKLKQKFPHIDIVAGNVSVAEAARFLAEAGADGVKVGQGPGSICTTRIKTGIGVPQVTAIHECAEAVREVDPEIAIIADGGIVEPGDIPIALGSGAHCVMLGKVLAGTDETPGDIITYQGQRVKTYRGMGSLEAMRESQASRARYGQTDVKKLTPEGIKSLVPAKGPVADVVGEFMGNLRSGMGYVGAANIAELHEKAWFRRMSEAGLAESRPHDVIAIDEDRHSLSDYTREGK